NNQHPIIGGNLFRYRMVNGAGQFDQVGQSWLKHAFTALQGNTCCSNCSPNPNGSALGVGCSDPYTSGRNGTQSGLGPHWQVNAHTGASPYPRVHPSGGNTGRLEVESADLADTTATTTKFYGESMYVNFDDAGMGNNNNNASWRGVTCTG